MPPPNDLWNASGAVFSGIVRTENGSLAQGALVALGDLDATPQMTLTDEQGRFSIGEGFHSYSSIHALVVQGGESLTGKVSIDTFGHDLAVDVRRPPPEKRAVIVHVTAHDGGAFAGAFAQAVSGKLAAAHAQAEWQTLERVRSELACGRFAVDARRWEDGETPVFVIAGARDGEGRALAYGAAVVRVDPRGAALVDASLPPGGVVSGCVVGGDGPRGGVTVVFSMPIPGASPESSCRVRDERRTDTEGRFSFSIPGDVAGEVSTEGADPMPVFAGADLVVRLR